VKEKRKGTVMLLIDSRILYMAAERFQIHEPAELDNGRRDRSKEKR